jgi:hypothetical protein
VATLLDRATYLRSAPLSADETAVHRPDLPFVAARDPAVSWADGAEKITAARSRLMASAIYLLPFGPGGGTKAGVRVTADNGSSFPPEELFGKARAVQARHLGNAVPVAGVGIYRSGLQRGLPAFYLWGAVSQVHESVAAPPTAGGTGRGNG